MTHRDGSLEHSLLENDQIVITQWLRLRDYGPRGGIQHVWDNPTICVTHKQLQQLAKKYLKGYPHGKHK
jgi:hypothetical protein